MDTAVASDEVAFLRMSDERRARAVRNLLAYAAEARTDPVAFFEFVFRAEDTQLSVKAMQHQVLALRFMERHRRFVLRMPAGSSKTVILLVMGLYTMGRERLMRGAVVSATEAQARKPVGAMRAYIEDSHQLALVFPWLQRNPDPDSLWSDGALTIDRPRGIRDATMRALGLDSKSIMGSRLSWALADDVLNGENTLTLEARDRLQREFDEKVTSRLDPKGATLGVTNTPWHQDDLTYRLERQGRPTLSMDIEGDIWFGGDLGYDPLDAYGEELIVPHPSRRGRYRLRRDYDDPLALPLWPERYSRPWIASMRGPGPDALLPHVFAQQLLSMPFDEAAARCQRAWVDNALELGAGIRLVLAQEGDGARRRYTGVDVGGVKQGNDKSAIATIEARPDKRRRLLNLQSGNWSGPELVKRIRAEALKYDSKVFVESNAAQQFIVDFTQEADSRLRVHSHFTSAANKHDQAFGVEAIFTELFRNLWEWPKGEGRPAPEVAQLADECVFYSPTTHMGDHLAALWLARAGLARPGEEGSEEDTKRAGAIGVRQFASGGGF